MKKLWISLKNNSGIIAWLLFGVAIVFSFRQVDESREEAKRQVCIAQLDAALTLRDLIDYSVGRNPNPEAQEIVKRFYQRIELPPPICEGTGVDVQEFFERTPTTLGE